MPDRIRFLSMDFFIALMITFFVLSVLSQILIGILYQHMLEEAENMQTTDNRILKQFKQKFVTCYTVNNGVTNVPVFVEKFLNRLQIGRFSLNMIRGLSGQFMFLSVLSGGIGICRELAKGLSFFSLLPYYVVILVGLYFYFSVLSIVDIPGRRSMLKTNMIDFLENDMLVRLAAGMEYDPEAKENTKEEAGRRQGRAKEREESSGLRHEEEELSARTRYEEEELPARTRYEQTVSSARKTARWDTDEEFDRKRMPVLEKLPKENPNKPEGLDWTGGMVDEAENRKPYFDKEKEEELAELLKDLLS